VTGPVVAHDSRLIAHADRVFGLEDGVLTESFHGADLPSQNGAHPRPFSLAPEA
jgi:hypothetical protein